MPGDKSISHRALLITSLANGRSRIQDLSDAADPNSTTNCLRALGITIQHTKNETIVNGKGLHGFSRAGVALDAGNSGTTMRLLSGILAGQQFDSTLVGDDSLSKRPMGRVADPLRQMGATIGLTDSGTAPMTIRGNSPLKPIDYTLPIPSAQLKSAVLFAGLSAEGTTTVREPAPSRDHTERMLGLRTVQQGKMFVTTIDGSKRIPPTEFLVPGDFSGAAFFIVAALITKRSELTIRNVGMNPTRNVLLRVLRDVGASIEVSDARTVAGEPIADLTIRSSHLKGDLLIDEVLVPQLIDEIPILAVLAMFLDGSFSVRHAAELRAKETDRIGALVENLRLLGTDVEEYADGFAFQSKKGNIGVEVDSFHDHRIAMSFGVAGLVIPGISIRNPECVAISFPAFWELMNSVSRTTPH